MTTESVPRETPEQDWCSNSRRWVIWMSMDSSIPWACPYKTSIGSSCVGEDCSYHQLRKPTANFKRKERIIREMFSDE